MCAYSLDLRERVVLYVESGHSRRSAAQIFNIGERTVRRWLELKKESGFVKKRQHGGGRALKVNEEALRSYVDANPDLSLEEIGKHFNVTAPAIWYKLREYGYVYKKNAYVRGKGRNKKS